MLEIKTPLPIVFVFLLLLPILTACTTTVPLCDNNNVGKFALQSNLAKKITKKQSLLIVRQFFEDIYSNQSFTDKKFEVNDDGFSVAYAQKSNDSGKQFIFMKSTWKNLTSIVAENRNISFGGRQTFEKFRVQFKGVKSILTDPESNHLSPLEKHEDLLFEKDIPRLKYSRRDVSLALLILSEKLSVIEANEAAQLADKTRAESKNKNTYKIVFIIFLLVLLFFVLKFKNMAATRSKRYCSTCKKAFDKDLDDCPTCGERATEIITPDGWTWHIRNDTLPGVIYAYLLAAIIILAIIVFLLLLITGI